MCKKTQRERERKTEKEIRMKYLSKIDGTREFKMNSNVYFSILMFFNIFGGGREREKENGDRERCERTERGKSLQGMLLTWFVIVISF